jgi:hypothetical protein
MRTLESAVLVGATFRFTWAGVRRQCKVKGNGKGQGHVLM